MSPPKRWQHTRARVLLTSIWLLGLALGASNRASADGSESAELSDQPSLALPPSPDDLAPFLVGIVEGIILGGVHRPSLCPNGEHCVLNTGGGLGARMEWRFPKRVSTGFGVELLLIDGSSLYEISTMQTLRYTIRVLGLRERRVHPLLDAAVGVALFGDSFTVDTFGGFLDLRGGIEVELNQQLAVDFGFGVRALTFAPYETALDGAERGGSFGLDLALGFHLGFVIMPRTTKPRILQPRRGDPEHLQPGAAF